MGDPCFQFPTHPYIAPPSFLQITSQERLNYIVEETENKNGKGAEILHEKKNKERDGEQMMGLKREGTFIVRDRQKCKSYLMEEEAGDMMPIPTVIEECKAEGKQRRNTRVEDTNSICELIKDLSEELDQLKRNRQLLENIRGNSATSSDKIEQKFISYAKLVDKLNGDSCDKFPAKPTELSLNRTTKAQSIFTVDELDRDHEKENCDDVVTSNTEEQMKLLGKVGEDEEDDEQDVENYELMSDPSSGDELWLLPQQVLTMDVELLQVYNSQVKTT